uniref:Zinc finger CCCH domain-containing protein 14 n=1 Tax=Anopheles christyi TaxID=43041 RepID=A0A182JUK8_9DIPT
MRSAVKAKLIELGTGSASGYIDDELPDYVMIMVANKRSRQQMIDDLSLFLGAQTEIFVNWLHQVLQKLQEVTLPASVAAKSKESTKRKSSEVEDKKKDKKRKDKKLKRRDRSTDGEDAADNCSRKSGEDNTPPRPASSITEVFAHQYIEQAKKSLESDSVPVSKKQPPERSESQDQTKSKTPPKIVEPLPSISDLASATVVQKHHKELCELKEIEERISAAKRHLKSLGTDISDDDNEDLLLLKASEDDLIPPRARSNQSASMRTNTPVENSTAKPRQRITMGPGEPAKQTQSTRSTTPPASSRSTDTQQAGGKKRSVLDRLGTKHSTITPDREKSASSETPSSRDTSTKDANKASSTSNASSSGTKSTIISLSAHRREEREIYVPLFRRKEVAEEQSAAKNRTRPPATTRGDNRQRESSREANYRDTRSPVSRLPPISRTDATRARSRETNFRRVDRDRDRDRERIDEQPTGRKSRPRERSRSREWIRDINRDRSGSGSRIKNGTDNVRGRVGSRVIVLPPKPEYNEDVIEVPVASVIKVQPRPVVPKATQPCKHLLLKAMAEAQRSTVANLKKTIDNTAIENNMHRTDMKRKLVIEIPGVASIHPPTTDGQYERVTDTHYTALLEGAARHERREEEVPEDVHEVDITNQVLMEDCDVDEEFKEILQNDYNVPNASGSHDYPIEMTVSEEDAAIGEQEMVAVESKDTKFVVTLDGAFKSSVDRELSPSHTPPPPPAASVEASQAKGRMSIKDRIGFKTGTRDPARKSPNPKDSKEMEETLKKRKERFCEKLIVAPAVTKSISKNDSSPISPSNAVPRGSSHGNSVSMSRSQKSPKVNPRSSHNNQSSASRNRTPSLSPERPRSPKNTSPTQSRSKRIEASRNVSSSPNQLNELLLQRTKELMDNSVSSSPIYMSKSDYDKMEPSSRKRKRVSPIQFNLTDEDEQHDSDDDYHHHHHRERRARSREEHRAQRSPSRDSDELSTTRKESRREWERESERRDNREGRQKSPGKKIKKLESSRKFDDIPPLLSAVSLAGLEGKNNKLVGGGTLKERCKYFPNCRQGDACEFLHPTTPCKAFPSCKFGDKCLYLHPMCKYDQTCHRLDCNFMHSKSGSPSTSGGLSAPPLASSVVPVQNYKTISAKPLPPVCKFYPNCVNTQCQFLHPKICRFGKHCGNRIECNFYHFDIQSKDLHDVSSKDKFRWISPFSA